MSEVKGNIVRIKSGDDQYAIKDTISDYITQTALDEYMGSNDFATAVFDLATINSNPYLTKEDAMERFLLKTDEDLNENLNSLSFRIGVIEFDDRVQNREIDDLQIKATPTLPIINGQYFLKYDDIDTNHYIWEKSVIPTLPTTNGQYLLKYDSADDNSYTWDKLAITELPSTDSLANGTYTLQCEKTANGTTLSWVSTSSSST